jgi:hypothetical protein
MAEMYIRTEALKTNESFQLEEWERIIHVDWPSDSKMLYLVIVGDVKSSDAARSDGEVAR